MEHICERLPGLYTSAMATKIPQKKHRGARLVATILDATLSEIARVGPYDVSIEEVANRANVNKTTIYRRWPTPEALTLAAFAHGSSRGSLPDTGSLRQDVIEYLREFREVCRTPAMSALARVQFTGELSGKAGAMIQKLLENNTCDTITMFQAAVKRGELPADTDIYLLRDLVIGGAQYLLLFRHNPLSEETLQEIVNIFLGGVGCVPVGKARGAGIRPARHLHPQEESDW